MEWWEQAIWRDAAKGGCALEAAWPGRMSQNTAAWPRRLTSLLQQTWEGRQIRSN